MVHDRIRGVFKHTIVYEFDSTCFTLIMNVHVHIRGVFKADY